LFKDLKLPSLNEVICNLPRDEICAVQDAPHLKPEMFQNTKINKITNLNIEESKEVSNDLK